MRNFHFCKFLVGSSSAKHIFFNDLVEVLWFVCRQVDSEESRSWTIMREGMVLQVHFDATLWAHPFEQSFTVYDYVCKRRPTDDMQAARIRRASLLSKVILGDGWAGLVDQFHDLFITLRPEILIFANSWFVALPLSIFPSKILSGYCDSYVQKCIFKELGYKK